VFQIVGAATWKEQELKQDWCEMHTWRHLMIIDRRHDIHLHMNIDQQDMMVNQSLRLCK